MQHALHAHQRSKGHRMAMLLAVSFFAISAWTGCGSGPDETNANADPGDRAPEWVEPPRNIALTADAPIAALSEPADDVATAESQARQTLIDLWPVRIHNALRIYLREYTSLEPTPREALMLSAWEHIPAADPEAITLQHTARDPETGQWQVMVAIPFAAAHTALMSALRWARESQPQRMRVSERTASEALRRALGRAGSPASP